MYVCEVHVSLSSVYAHASMCAGMWLDHSILYMEAWSLLEPGAHLHLGLFISLATLALGNGSQSARIQAGCHVHLDFTWVLGISTLVFYCLVMHYSSSPFSSLKIQHFLSLKKVP